VIEFANVFDTGVDELHALRCVSSDWVESPSPGFVPAARIA